MEETSNGMEKIVSLCKRRGFVFQGSEIYGGLAGTWDYGPLGVALKKSIEHLWWKHFVTDREDMYGIDSAILMNPRVWEASGHTGAGFSDPLVECDTCKRRFRADHLENRKVCPECGGSLGEERQFNLMFETAIGAQSDAKVYLRPETAQGMFVNFKNILDTYHPKLPFGIAQIGRAFRNEIAPRDFIFRVRELDIMELEYFVKENEWKVHFEAMLEASRAWFHLLGFDAGDLKEIEIPDGERAHYSQRTIDFHFKYPHAFDEIGGLAYRADFDLKQHSEHSKVDLSYFDEELKERYVPHAIEPTFGLGRHIMAVLVKAYTEDEMNGEVRTYLKLPANIAPYRVCVSPLLKNKSELVAKAREVFLSLKKIIPNVAWDDNGNIGKRYRRQDEIGTPACVTIDFDTLGENPELKDTVTLRDRDTGIQKRVAIADLVQVLMS